ERRRWALFRILLEVDREAALEAGAFDVAPDDRAATRRGIAAGEAHEKVLPEEVDPVGEPPVDPGADAEPLPRVVGGLAARRGQRCVGQNPGTARAERGEGLEVLQETPLARYQRDADGALVRARPDVQLEIAGDPVEEGLLGAGL